MNEQTRRPIIYVVSDSVGETGEFVVRAAIQQFHPVRFDIRRAPFVEDTFAADRVLETVERNQAMIAFTLVMPELREYLVTQAAARGVVAVDLLGPLIEKLEHATGREASHLPGMSHQLDLHYNKKIEAIEFAVKYDDGQDPQGVLIADLVLIGVSRTSKTPLSMYLANKRYKVANVPLIPELKPPEELFQIDANKIIGLTISSEKLNDIRRERLRALGLSNDAIYAQSNRIDEELSYSQSVMQRIGCKQIDVSNKAVEETANIIEQLIRLN